MPKFKVTRNELGKICGVDEVSQRAYNRFVKRMHAVTHDDDLIIEWKEPRSLLFHRYHFKILDTIFKAQDFFNDFDVMRKWLEIKAGFVDEVRMPGGGIEYVPRSIAWHELDDVEFYEHHIKVKQALRSLYVTQRLWPHLDDYKGLDMVDRIIDSFELPRVEPPKVKPIPKLKVVS